LEFRVLRDLEAMKVFRVQEDLLARKVFRVYKVSRAFRVT
jgi:hypothetical protein